MSLAERVDDHFRSVKIALHDVNGMMRHVLDSLGALKHRLKEDTSCSKELIHVFGSAVKVFVDHITDFEHIDEESAIPLLVETFPDESKRRDGRGWLPVHWAAALHDTEPEHMEKLVKERPLALTKGHLHCMTSVEVAGNASYNGLMPLHAVVSLKHPNLLNASIILEGYPAALTSVDHRGWLPIHWCAYNCGNIKVLNYLVKRNSDGCFQVTKKGKLPFQLAAYNRCIDVMDTLAKVNPEALNGADYNGNTPLHDAVKTLNHEGVARLLQLKPDIGWTRNFREQLPIHKAFCFIPEHNKRLHFRQLETIKSLLKASPETASTPDENDSLPLHLAVFHKSSADVVRALLDVYPSAALVKDNYGKLPIHYVHNAEIKSILMKASPSLVRVGMTDTFARFVT